MSTVRFNTQFPGYEVLSELGRSNARVLKARQVATGDLVAIKHFALNTDAETLRRFERESVIMTGITHPNIVRIREVQLEADLPYIVMELIEGGNLRQLLTERGSLDVPTATRLGLQLASAFNAFHPQGIVHRDIKPENILYRPLPSGELHFLLTDFGVARLHEQSNTLTGQSLMTYEYASPEQFNDPKNVDVATDYYSLGVVLYECLTGHVPFALGNQAGIVTFMNTVLHDAPPPLTVSPTGQSLRPFSELVTELLTKQSTDRISNPDELTWLLKQAELNYLRAGQSISHRTTSAGTGELLSTGNTRGDSFVPSAPNKLTKNSSARWLNLVALGIFVGLGGLGIYYFMAASGPLLSTTAATTIPSSVGNDSMATQTKPPVDSAQIWREEAVHRQEQRYQQALLAGAKLGVEITDFRVGFLGGLKGVQLQLSNPSPVPFTSVTVLVSYIKEKGGLFKSERVIFTDVGPNSSPARHAPDSDRGTRLTCKIVNYTLPDSLMQTDSSASVSPANPLN